MNRSSSLTVVLVMLSLSFSSCDLLFPSETQDIAIESISSSFALNDDLVFYKGTTSPLRYTTYVIDTKARKLVSRIVYANGKGQYGPVSTVVADNRLWIHGPAMSKKILVLNTETGVVEKTITTTQDNAHEMYVLPKLGKLLILHGRLYEEGFKMSVIDIATRSYERTVFVHDFFSGIWEDSEGTIWGNGKETVSGVSGFGSYTLTESEMVFTSLMVADLPGTASEMRVQYPFFTVLEDSTVFVPDCYKGIKVRYPDGTIESLVTEDPEESTYCSPILYCASNNRVFVEWAFGKGLVAMDLVDGKWAWRKDISIDYVNSSSMGYHIVRNGMIVRFSDTGTGDQLLVDFYNPEDLSLLTEISEAESR